MDAQLFGDREMVVRLRAFGPAVVEQLTPTVRGLQLLLQNAIKRLLSGDILRNRTGNLRESFVPGEIEVTESKVSGVVGSNLVYARIQDAGGQIVPKNAQNLTIPMQAVLTANGVARYSAREVISNPAIGGFTGTFFAKGMLFGKGAGGITPLFKLKKSVTIPPHQFMARALSEVEPAAQEQMNAALETAAKKIQGA